MKKYILKSGIALLIIGLFIACNEENETNSLILLDHTSSYYNSESGFTLQLDSVLNESRCPTGLVCVWAGNAEE